MKSPVISRHLGRMGRNIFAIICWGVLGLGVGRAAGTGVERLLIQDSVHPKVQGLAPLRRATASLSMDGMVLCLKRSQETQTALDAFLASVNNPSSPLYHQWLTPSEFGNRFGASQDSVDAAVNWLVSQGFSVESISPSRMNISFSGSRDLVESAFQTQMMYFEVDGALHHANATPVSIPSELAGIVAGPLSLTNIPRIRPHVRKSAPRARPMLNLTSGDHLLAPGDFATIYGLQALYSAGKTGSGVTIAIAGQSNINPADVTSFRSYFSLPTNAPSVVLAGTNPGLASDMDEALLDVVWSGAVAKDATIKLVIATSTNTMSGVEVACQYIVDNNLAPIMSLSYGLCEADLTSTWNTWYGNLWAQAAAEGITVCVSSGDSGPAECDSASASKGTKLAVNGLASTPYNVAVGGTQFNEGSGSYWSSSNSSDYSSVLSYIPEIPWNESAAVSGGSGLYAGGGGTSTVWTKPSWQSVTGSLSSGGYRDLPDVSLAAASHDGYAVCEWSNNVLYWYDFSGTSASAPSFAGIMALIVQTYGRQGNPNPTLYALGRAQYGSNAFTVFNDVTSGNNTVPGVTGYTAVTGYDRATGLGSVNAYALWSNWGSYLTAAGPTITTQPQNQVVAIGNSATFTVAATGTGTLGYQWQVSTDSGTTWSKLTTGSGYVTASYTTPVTTSSDNGKIYRVQVRDGSGAIDSSTATLMARNLDFLGDGGSPDLLDLALLARAYGTQSGGTNWFAGADLNGDGDVNQSDLTLFLNLAGF